MFGFGDSHIPNPDTVSLVENITLNQMRLIVEEAIKVQTICSDPEAPPEDKKTLSGEELVFLMRKDKYKMRRFLKYLYSQMQKHVHSNFAQPVPVQAPPKHNKLIEFIEYIDETGELTDLSEYDEVKYERMVRADRMSLALGEEAYMKFYKARCSSFMQKSMSQIRNFERLKQWIDPGNTVNFTNDALNVLSYYAYETVALIIDYALLVRLDHNRKADPLENLQGTHYSADMFKGEQFNGPNPDYSRVYSGQAPISVNEIKEVMRRLYMPQAGICLLGKKMPSSRTIIVV